MSNPAQIAATLTKAQRDAMLDARHSIVERCLCLPPSRSRAALINLGLASASPARTISGGKSSSRRLTALGFQVRAILEEQTDGE